MIKKLAALLLFLHFSVAYSQTIKTDVLVIGGTPSGVAAAIQCARSKVKTVLVEEDSIPVFPGFNMANTQPGLVTPGGMSTINTDRNLPSGIWGEFREKFKQAYAKKLGLDTVVNAPLKFDTWDGAGLLQKIADTVKNLSIDLNTKFISIKKDDDRWDVTISQNGKLSLIKARVVIDATESGMVVKGAGLTYSLLDVLENTAQSKIYRTSIAMGDNIGVRFDTIAPLNNYPPFPAYTVPIKALIVKGADNLLFIGNLLPGKNELPAQLTLGQGAGVTAAYCAFFKTTTANLKVRAIQVELLDFKGYLLPLADISGDPYWRAIQQVCATGMLKGKQKMVDGHPQFLFMPDSIVTTAEVKPVLTEIYTRAFLWFNMAKPGKEFTVGNLLSFISELTLTDPDNLQRKIEKEWSAQYKFKSAFDMERPITRREFAILANKYLNPFARTVDMDGRIVN